MSEEQKATQPQPQKVQKHIAPVQLGRGVLFRSMAEVWATARAFVDNGLSPKARDGDSKDSQVAKVAAAMIKGLAIGLDPVTSMSTITVVNGRAKSDVNLRLGLVRKSGLLAEWVVKYEGEKDTKDYKCLVFARRADTGEPCERDFSVADAQKAGLWNKDVWRGYGEKRMLYNRAAGFVLDDLFSDVVLGFDHGLPGEPEVAPDDPGDGDPTKATVLALARAPRPSGADPLLDGLMNSATTAVAGNVVEPGVPGSGDAKAAVSGSSPDSPADLKPIVEAQISKGVDEALPTAEKGAKAKKTRTKRESAENVEAPAEALPTDDGELRGKLFSLALTKVGGDYDQAMQLLKKAAGTVVINALKGRELRDAYEKMGKLNP